MYLVMYGHFTCLTECLLIRFSLGLHINSSNVISFQTIAFSRTFEHDIYCSFRRYNYALLSQSWILV